MKVCSIEVEVKLIYKKECLPLVTDSMQMGAPHPHILIGPNNIWSWLARMELLWLVGEDVNEDIAIQLQLDGGKSQFYQ